MEKPESFISQILAGLGKTGKTLREVFYGFTAYELEVELRKEKGNLNNLLMLMVFGDLIGLPSFPPYYSMRILPHIIPYIDTWKRSILREKDLTDKVSIDI
jgi:hypothetical protein